MNKPRDYKGYQVWKEAIAFATEVYKVTNTENISIQKQLTALLRTLRQ